MEAARPRRRRLRAQWLNPLGRWDWWELGGRFDGLVSGEKRAGAGSASMISPGPNRGRDLLGGVARALGGKPSEAEAEIAANIDLVASLLDAAAPIDTPTLWSVKACYRAVALHRSSGKEPAP